MTPKCKILEIQVTNFKKYKFLDHKVWLYILYSNCFELASDWLSQYLAQQPIRGQLKKNEYPELDFGGSEFVLLKLFYTYYLIAIHRALNFGVQKRVQKRKKSYFLKTFFLDKVFFYYPYQRKYSPQSKVLRKSIASFHCLTQDL